MTKPLYHYDVATGEFLGSSMAEADPLELEIARAAARAPILEAARRDGEAGLAAAASARDDARAAAQTVYAQTVSQITAEGEEFEVARAAAEAIRNVAQAAADHAYEEVAAAIQSAYEAAETAAGQAADAVEPTIWMMPAHTTEIEPPEAELDKVRVFRNDAWAQVADLRGKIFYAPDRTRHVITELSVEPDPTWTAEEPPLSTTELWEAVRSERGLRMSDALAILDRHRNQKDFGLATTITDANAMTWAIYLQALRDVPETQSDPAAIVWPSKPSEASA